VTNDTARHDQGNRGEELVPTLDLAGLDLADKVAIVTGSGRGLGRAYAEALGAAGASVVVNDVDEVAANDAVDAIAGSGGSAVAEVVPVGSTEAAERLVKRAVSEFGRLDILVTNAGVLRDKVLWKMSDDDFDTVIEVHLRGTFTCARAAAVQMREQESGGRIILVASPAGQRGNFGQTNYAAAKAGIAAMARTWSMELERAGITCNAIVPIAATEMTKTIPAFAPIIDEAERTGEPLPAWLRQAEGFGTPHDCAGLVAFLASDAAAGVTGQCIGIGGDKLALWAHPHEVATAYRSGGWSAADIAEVWGTSVGANPQSVGIPAPAAPES
jgi:NAD(P)-dependent dehydrogenase (short-subunit alcohol dehydrogenase family)